MQSVIGQGLNLDSLNQKLRGEAKDNTPKKVDVLLLMAKEWQEKKDQLRAMQYANIATIIADELKYTKGIAQGFFTMAVSYENSGTKSKALEYYQRSAKYYQYVPDQISQLARCYRSIGNIYYSFGDYKEALQYHLEAKSTYEQAKDKKGIAASYSNIGIVQAALGDVESALNSYDRTIEMAKEANELKSIGIAYNNIATAHEKQDKFTLALEYYERALNIFKELNAKDNLANTLVGVGDVYRKQGNANEALKKYVEAREIQEKSGDQEALAYTNMGLGDILASMGRIDKAIEYYQKSLKAAQSLGLKETIRDNYYRVSGIYEKMGQTGLAYQTYKAYKVYDDSIYNDARLSLIAELQVRYKTDLHVQDAKQQKSINEAINAEKNKQALEFTLGIRNREFIIIGAFVFLVLSLVFLYLINKGRNQIKNINVQLQTQNIEISQQKEEIEGQRQTVERTLRKLNDSIQYAKTIQDAILPSAQRMRHVLGEYFIIYRAKDIVSGDFYWLNQIDNKIFVALVDCTGHGVSGGFMSMIGNALLSEIINQEKVHSPAEILELLNESVTNLIETRSQHIAIGMELALCVIEPAEEEDKTKITFSGAKRPLFILHKNHNPHVRVEIEEIKGGREPIGFAAGGERNYENVEIIVEKGSQIYMCSDGFADQANKANKRFGTPRLKKVLEEFSNRSLFEQQKALEKQLNEFQNDSAQRDDITLMGIRV
jgi:serine phosphatase RsbU (regulator of sigma subunit)